jgi:hypothetical protein
MSQEEARELVEHDTIRADLRNRIRYALWVHK